jgi:energy-converting hydrogenase Eha subunit E
VFLFFSSRLGCLGSIAVSLLVSLVLLRACGMV